MAVTATEKSTIKKTINNGSPNDGWDALRKVKLGDMLEPIKETVTLGTPATTINLATQTTAKKAALVVGSVRVTAGAAAAGPRQITDAGGTPSATVATISDDGKTLTFEANVTTAIISWVPRAAVDPDGTFENT